MDIKIGTQYRIRSDSCNFILQELVPPSSKSKTGKPTWGRDKFYPQLSQALQAIVTSDMRKSQAESIKELQADLYKSMRTIEEAAKEMLACTN